MSDLAPSSGSATPAPVDSDNQYKAVQAKLARFGAAMDDAAQELEALHRDIKANASHAEHVAGDITNAELDVAFVVLTSEVAGALGSAAVDVKTLGANAQEIVTLTYQAKRTHSHLYAALDDVRSNRRERTPRPGFFDR